MRSRHRFNSFGLLAAVALGFSLTAGVCPTRASLLTNGDFEATPFDDGWTHTIGIAKTTNPISGTTSMRLNWNTTGNVLQDVSGEATDFTFDFRYQQAGVNSGRTMNAVLHAGSEAVNSRVLVGTDENILQVYDGSAWQDISTAGDFSSITDPYRVQIVGHDWGTSSATYDLLWSDAGSTDLTHQSLGLSYFQTPGPTQNGLSQVRFARRYDDSHSWWVDDVVLDASVLTLADYSFPGNSPVSADTEPLSLALDYTPKVGGLSGFFGNAYARASDVTSGDEATAVANDSYHSFTVSPDMATALDLDSLVYDYSVDNSHNSVSFSSFLRSSVDDFSTTLASHTFSGLDGDTPIEQLEADLSGEMWDFLTDDVEFRIYFYDTSTASTRIHRIDNVALYGKAVPEPGTLVLSLLGLFGVALLRRFRRT